MARVAKTSQVFIRDRLPDDPLAQITFKLVDNDESLDLTEHVYLQTQGGIEEWVHKDDLAYWKEVVRRNKSEKNLLKRELKDK